MEQEHLGAIHIPRGQVGWGGGIPLLSTRGTEGVGLESTWTHVPLNLRKIY